jgi:hypothetical protein
MPVLAGTLTITVFVGEGSPLAAKEVTTDVVVPV